MTDNHGYSAYSHGCRCDVCREAKRDYIRERRRGGLELALERGRLGTPRAAGPIRHGSQYAYYERGCRCTECITGGRTYRAGGAAAKASA